MERGSERVCLQGTYVKTGLNFLGLQLTLFLVAKEDLGVNLCLWR